MATVKPPSPKTTKPPAPKAGGETAAEETKKSKSWRQRFGNLFGDKKEKTKEDKPEQVKEKSTFNKLKDNTNNVANKLLNAYFKGDTDTDNLTTKSPSAKILKGILKLMVQIETQRKMDDVQDLKSSKVEERETEKRHREILKALTVRRKPRRKPKKETTKAKKETTQKQKQKKATTGGGTGKGGKTTATKAPSKGTTAVAATGAGAGATAAAVSTGTMVATTGLLAAASMSVRGETGSADLVKVKGDSKRVGQVVPNDPKPGVSSYGVFGINSGGSVQKFVADNPQFNLKGTPGTKDFDDSWKRAAIDRTDEFYNAQLSWYSRYVYEPTKKDMQTALPANLGSSDKIVTYMADRRNQMGKLYESEAIKYAKESKTPEEFISKIAEHDASEEFIKKAFPTYLKNNGMQNIAGLKNRVELRKQMSMQVQVESNEGAKIDNKSSENKEIKKDMQEKETANKVVNNVSVQQTNEQQKSQKKVDDRSIFDLLKG